MHPGSLRRVAAARILYFQYTTDILSTQEKSTTPKPAYAILGNATRRACWRSLACAGVLVPPCPRRWRGGHSGECWRARYPQTAHAENSPCWRSPRTYFLPPKKLLEPKFLPRKIWRGKNFLTPKKLFENFCRAKKVFENFSTLSPVQRKIAKKTATVAYGGESSRASSLAPTLIFPLAYIEGFRNLNPVAKNA